MSTKAVTVEDASPSPPPSPNKATTDSAEGGPTQPPEEIDVPIPEATKPDTTDSDQAEAGEEWDPSAETSLKGKRDAVVEKNADGTVTGGKVAQGTGGWQAVWAPANNAYYFWNAETGAVTWENPLAPKAEGSTSISAVAPPLPVSMAPVPPESSWGAAYGAPSSSTSAYAAPSYAAPGPSSLVPQIDPGLAHLLPKSTSAPGEGYQSAQFNARTGRFTPADYAFTVDHLAEANRAKRQEGVFFDVDAWEKQREEEHRSRLLAQAEEKKRKADEVGEGVGPAKKLSKKDIERFKAKKEEKKARNNAWLRG